MKIALFTDNFLPGVGGTEKVVFEMGKSLQELGHEVIVACPKYKKYDDSVLPFPVLRVKSIKLTNNNEYYGFPFLSCSFKKKLKEFAPDIIHCHSIPSMIPYAIHYGKKYNIPVFSTIHTNYKMTFKNSIKFNFIVNMLIKGLVNKIKKCDKVFTVSNDMARELKSYGYNKEVNVIKNGTNFIKQKNLNELKKMAKEKYKLSDKDFVFLFVGHIAKFKNIQMILESLREVKEVNSNFKMLFVGKGIDFEYFKKLSEDLGLSKQVLFTGEIKDKILISSIYANANLYLFPSICDTYSLTVDEAAAHSVPSLVIENTGSSERITNDVSGFVVKNNLQEYINKIIALMGNKDLLKEVGKNASNMILKTWKEIAQEYCNFYNQEIDKFKNNNK